MLLPLILAAASLPFPVQPEAAAPTAPAAAKPASVSMEEAFAQGTARLIALQHTYDPKAKEPPKTPDGPEWPYEGVYRVGGDIPVAYRIGGTAIVVESLIKAPGYAENAAAKEAVAKAVDFIIATREHPLMSEAEYDAGYDVRGWGYCYGLRTLSILKRANLMPEGRAQAAETAAKWYLDAMQKTEIPEVGGWNYARPAGRAKVAAPSSFMTAACLESLYEAKAAGYEVDAAVVNRALDCLERSRGPAGNVTYSIDPRRASGTSNGDRTPGAIGRMCAVESALVEGGRGSVDRVRGAVDAFIVHWKWIDDRRAKTGTHVGPYAVAPYYFMFAHHYAARAVELLPENERAEYRKRINDLLMSVRSPDGSWNDRVFTRSSAYGTAFAMLSLGMPKALPQATWKP
ncbi:MAG: terpene cyclase/mutase family protein [Tepidisphaera sp.]